MKSLWPHARTQIVASILLICGAFAISAAETVTIKPADCVIVTPAEMTHQTEAAAELQKHLKLVTGTEVEVLKGGDVPAGKYPFYVGITPPDDNKPLAAQEARWTITPTATYLYGGDYSLCTQYAVYGFLEDQLGVHWIEPGDDGIAYKEQSPLKLTVGEFGWVPQFVFRQIRQGIRTVPETADSPPSVKEHNRKVLEEVLWKRRMRMGGQRPGGAHAFSEWWDKYGKTHPEYFALNKFGKREPVPHRKPKYTNAFIKICPSCPGVADQIVADWLPKKDRVRYVSAGPNDGYNFCECDACRALDVPKEGEKFGDHLTDRYVYLANAVARKVRQIRPDAWVTMYAYVSTFYPPRKLKLEPNVLVMIAWFGEFPMTTPETEALFKGWRDAGAKKIAFRPNYYFKYFTGTVPLGLEKQVFDVFQTAAKYGCVAFDYDNGGFAWQIYGMANYILAKAMAEPDKPFEYWEDQYCSAYGDAADDVKAYFRYWRNEVWDKRLLPNIEDIADEGGAGNFVRGLMWNLGKYYTPEDFDITDAILQKAAKKNLTASEVKRLERLILANQHARLVYNAVVAKGPDKCEPAKELIAFRKAHEEDLPYRWKVVIGQEIGLGDITGVELAESMQDYLPPWLETDLVWRFRLDPDDVGLTEKWQKKLWEQTGDWEKARTDKFWENQADEETLLSQATREKLEKYDGIAWYSLRYAIPEELRGREIYLRFGAVDESCWVYVNGRLAGEHLFKNTNDWKTPFEIQIDPYINWDQQYQLITVRVEDKSGMGGVWRRVWVVSKEK